MILKSKTTILVDKKELKTPESSDKAKSLCSLRQDTVCLIVLCSVLLSRDSLYPSIKPYKILEFYRAQKITSL